MNILKEFFELLKEESTSKKAYGSEIYVIEKFVEVETFLSVTEEEAKNYAESAVYVYEEELRKLYGGIPTNHRFIYHTEEELMDYWEKNHTTNSSKS